MTKAPGRIRSRTCLAVIPGFSMGAFLTLLTPSPGIAQVSGGYGEYLAWKDWAKGKPFVTAGLASSWDRHLGDIDANRYVEPPGLILDDRITTAAKLTGPGIIYRFWMPHRAASTGYSLRMFFDGEALPRIDTTSDRLLDGLFGYFADPLVTTFAGGQVSYEPIVFRDSLRIVTENIANEWHWYQYSYLRFPPGTDLSSYTGTLDPETLAARSSVVAMFDNAGEHPAGGSATSVWTTTGASVVPAGGALVLADLTGPGWIRRLNVDPTGAGDAELDSLRLRISYEGRAEAAIDAPVSWFFGAGHGRVPYRSLPLGTDSPDGFYCYWPMPFRSSVRVALFNSSATGIAVQSTRVEHEPGPVGDDAGYLRTMIQDTHIVGGQTKNVIAQVTGAGHYVGNLLFIRQEHDAHFFLEGDDVFVVDGADTLAGTGLEDAYNGGFYYNWVVDPMDEPEGPSPASAIRPLSGILKVERTAVPELGRADQYRWQIADRVPFTESLEVSFETQYSWAPSHWQSVAFWYELPAVPTGTPTTPPSGSIGDTGPELRLFPGAPNPATDATRIRFFLPREMAVVLEVLDVRGRRVETLLDGRHPAGSHDLRWLPGDLPSGVYFFQLRAGAVLERRKIVLVR